MAEPVTGRRYLLTTAVCSYLHEPDWDRAELEDDVGRVVDLFTGLGYEHVPVLGLDPAKNQLLGRLREFCTSPERAADDYVVVYFAGHGEVQESSNEHVLLTADTRPDDLSFTALHTKELARVLVEETPLRRVLLMLDTCESGSGGGQAASMAASIDAEWGKSTPERGFVVIASTQPYQQALPGAFTKALVRAVHSVATAGAMPESLQIDAVLAVMQAQQVAQSQQVVCDAVRLTGRVPAFFPNPRAGATVDRIDLLLSDRVRQQDLRAAEFSRELLPKAKASFNDGEWHFEGRHEALRAVTGWLAGTTAKTAGMVVTGAPGSGKSALVGLVCALADEGQRDSVPTDVLGLPKDALPREGAVHAVIYARGATQTDVLAGIAAAVGTTATTIGALVEHARRWPTPTVVAVDALDEAVDPEQLVASVLRPLLDDRDSSCLRLLLGTRRNLLPLLSQRTEVVDLDSVPYGDPAAVRAHVSAGLRAGGSSNPFHTTTAAYIEAVAEAVATAAGHSFLVARLITGALVAAPGLPDPSDAEWRDSLPTLPGDAMRGDLRQRFGDDLERAYDLLAALAHAEGQGLPWENLWAAVSSRIGGTRYEYEDVRQLLRRGASSYVVEDTLEGRSVYRLYHQALAEHVRELRPATGELHAGFAEVLEASVPRRADGGADWERANPYVRHHFATHAARGGVLGRYLSDPLLLVVAAPERLRLVLRGFGGPEAAAFQEYSIRGIGQASRERRLAHLLMAARRTGAMALAEATEDMGRQPGRELPWRVPWAHWQSDQRVDRVLTHSSTPTCVSVGGPGELLTLDAAGLIHSWDLATEMPRVVGSVFGGPLAVLHEGTDGAAVVAKWEGSRVVARHVDSGDLAAKGPAFTKDAPTTPKEQGPVAVLATDDGWYVAAVCFKGPLGHGHSVYRVGVQFTSYDGTGTWSKVTTVKNARGLAGLEIVEDDEGQVLVVTADTKIVSAPDTAVGDANDLPPRIDQARLLLWRPSLEETTTFVDTRGSRRSVCPSTACAVGRIDGAVVLALATADGVLHTWRLRPKREQWAKGKRWTNASQGGAPVTAMAFANLRGVPVLLYGDDGGAASILSFEENADHNDLLHIGTRRITALQVVHGFRVAVASEDGQVIVYRAPAAGAATAPHVLGLAGACLEPVVYASLSDGSVHAYDAASGDLLASRQPDGPDPVQQLAELGSSGRMVLSCAASEVPATWHWSDQDTVEQGAPGVGELEEPTSVRLTSILVMGTRTVLTFTAGRSLRNRKATALWQFPEEAAPAAVPVPMTAAPHHLLPGLPGRELDRQTVAAAAADGGWLVALLLRNFLVTDKVRVWQTKDGTPKRIGRFPVKDAEGARPLPSEAENARDVRKPTALAVGTCAGAPAVAVGNYSGAVQLLDARSGKHLPVSVRPHHGSVTALALREAAFGCLLVSASSAGTVIFTDLRTHRSVTADLGEPVVALTMCSDGTVVAATASGLTAVRMGTAARRMS